ncbi:M20/M25/M40 family metallo-hydrolase [Actinokineospora sp. PR83]|uniref:M20/M25/M40 family metallo-hydrolase n=1 Tax=Actinokineospora sp. PR83 TaxID=2884908 RepID=UPI0027E07479|nr:M20/M25/M40 family metallo-hydrolase [Actinokineospora sp. PR83]MCG8918860.1 M20/M25/M40 family metallo-hydrolase [Actinokineospora sp. PR83]
MSGLRAADVDWLLALLAVPTVSPLEGGDTAGFARAQSLFAGGAAERGLALRRWDHPPAEELDRPDVPTPLREAAAPDPAGFLAAQPCVVVGTGKLKPPRQRMVINFHLDTVGPHIAPVLDRRVLRGRGAVDDKGPGVAAVVGVSRAFAEDPGLTADIEVLVASVPGEEGGAMGVCGTRWLVETGCVGRLMVFAEPTGCRVLDACSATMTPVLGVRGLDSTDDRPADGHNATVALGFLAVRLTERLGRVADRLGARVCVSGVHTGRSHNRVYGTGELRLNIAYHDRAVASALALEVERAVAEAGAEAADRFGDNPVTRRLVADWDRVVRLDWLKRGLPPLANRDAAMEAVLAEAGLHRHDGVADGSAFTCDAIWAPGRDRYVVACGPGLLDRDGAHTPDEHVRLDDLDEYADRVRALVHAFGAHVRSGEEKTA